MGKFRFSAGAGDSVSIGLDRVWHSYYSTARLRGSYQGTHYSVTPTMGEDRSVSNEKLYRSMGDAAVNAEVSKRVGRDYKWVGDAGEALRLTSSPDKLYGGEAKVTLSPSVNKPDHWVATFTDRSRFLLGLFQVTGWLSPTRAITEAWLLWHDAYTEALQAEQAREAAAQLEKMRRAVQDAMDAHTVRSIGYGESPGAVNTARLRSDIRSNADLLNALHRHSQNDPLKDVPADWVAVLHPAIYSHVLDWWEGKQPMPARALGREVITSMDAPYGLVHYMSRQMAADKYPADWQRYIEGYNHEADDKYNYRFGDF